MTAPAPSTLEPTPADRVRAARLAAHLEALDVEIHVRGAADGSLAIRACAPSAILAAALTPELRAAIAALKPALIAILDPLERPISVAARSHSAALILAREDPAWSRLDGLEACANQACGASCSHRAPDGRPRHPWCYPIPIDGWQASEGPSSASPIQIPPQPPQPPTPTPDVPARDPLEEVLP